MPKKKRAVAKRTDWNASACTLEELRQLAVRPKGERAERFAAIEERLRRLEDAKAKEASS